MKFRICTLLAVTLISSSAMAQICKTTIAPSNQLEQYVFSHDGIVVDARTGLMWQRCTVGQTWNADNRSCGGQPTHFESWEEAMNGYAGTEAESYGGFDGWRLPNIKELETIVERSCYSPAINDTVFPSTPNAVTYSSTPDDKVNDSLNGRVIDFVSGAEFVRDVNQHRYVRLVREVQAQDFDSE
ncbi:DUF1566 domain-containing protein [Neiella sp. HB171785]|uniref:DUF1566 domain-containing protein n=1 Tax=Neiella litorisoli TaxID=2771431 RepID=A0A8J6QIS8_9GAMM|nr:DUF1566 domain-containing protein [Neiella litorisoli]MBD1389543.1 DUF1566 domain-containing protein [Neiella litorisoli]